MKRYRLASLVLVLAHGMCLAQLPVILHEKFDKNSYGWVESDGEAKLEIKDGKYFLRAPEGGWMTYLTPFIESGKDFALQATFRQLNGNDNNGIGFIWGYDGDKINSFTFTTNGYYRIWCSDPAIGIADEWHETSLVQPMGEDNVLKVEQRLGSLYYYLNGQLLTTTTAFPWFGKQLGFVAYTSMDLTIDDFIFSHDVKINLPPGPKETFERENLGSLVNSIYDEVSPIISADGKTLYFGRKNSPDNVGGVDDKEDIWLSEASGTGGWRQSRNMTAVNTESVNNLMSVSTDNNTLLFHVSNGFGFAHRTISGWTEIENIGVYFDNESDYLEGSLSADGKAIIFAAKFPQNLYYRAEDERDIYVCEKKSDGTWSAPIHTGRVLNTSGDEYSPFLSADGKTLYYATGGKPGFGDVDVFMSRRLSSGWTQWSEPVNLGIGINTVGFDAYYTVPASGDYGYMVSNIQSVGLADIIRFKLPRSMRPDPVVLIAGKVLNAKTRTPLEASIRFDDLQTGREVGEARSDPGTGDYRIVLPAGKNYGYHAAAPGFLSLNENMELVSLRDYTEVRKDLYLVPIEIGESIQLRNVFFVQSKPELKPESYPELDRLVTIMKENPTVEIELEGHTDGLGNAQDNLELSQKRVQAVKNYLVEKGISSARITGKGYGGTRPVAKSDTEANRQLNRRVEFKITRK